MGSMQVGYLVKGPKDLGPKALERAKVRCERVLELCKELSAEDCADHDAKRAELLSLAPSIEQHLDVLDLWAGRDAEEVIANLVDFWLNGAHDGFRRDDPDDPTKRIAFAGTETWGDEPDGLGYTALRDADVLGVLDSLEIL